MVTFKVTGDPLLALIFIVFESSLIVLALSPPSKYCLKSLQMLLIGH